MTPTIAIRSNRVITPPPAADDLSGPRIKPINTHPIHQLSPVGSKVVQDQSKQPADLEVIITTQEGDATYAPASIALNYTDVGGIKRRFVKELSSWDDINRLQQPQREWARQYLAAVSLTYLKAYETVFGRGVARMFVDKDGIELARATIQLADGSELNDGDEIESARHKAVNYLESRGLTLIDDTPI